MSSSISALPMEIIVMVISQLKDQASLSRLGRCSKLFNTLVIPYLYQNISLYRVAALSCFTRHILNYPHLASLAKSLFVAFTIPNPPGRHRRVPSREAAQSLDSVCGDQAPPDLETAGAVQTTSHSERDQILWLAELCDGSRECDALLAVLLPALENLEDLDTSFPRDSAYCFRMLQCNVEKECTRIRPFGCLSHFTTSLFPAENGHHVGVSYQELAFLCKLPSLRSFRGCLQKPRWTKLREHPGHFVHGRVDAHWLAPSSFHEMTSNLTHFELWNSKIHCYQTRCILEACRFLRTFIFECKESSINGSGNIWMSASAISRQPAYVSDSLEKVVLCTVNRNKAS